MKNNVILTGTPRSGTTLTCHLLNKLPDVLALHEPIGVNRYQHLMPDHEAVAGGIGRFFNRRMRPLILEEGLAQTKHRAGEVPDNPFGSAARGEGGASAGTSAKTGGRQSDLQKGQVAHNKELSEDFTLVIKQPAMFSALLTALVGRFPSYAIIRNPLSTLASWNSVEIPLRQGHAHAAEKYDPSLPERLEGLDRHGRQLYMLSWFYERFEANLPPENIIRYEDIVSSGGKTLSRIHPAASELDEPLESKNKNPLYDGDETKAVAERLLSSDGPYWRFYSPSEVEALL